MYELSFTIKIKSVKAGEYTAPPAGNGVVTINKLQVGGSNSIRDIRFGVVTSTSQRNTHLFPTPMIGVPTIVIATIIASNTTQLFSITCDQYATTGFRFTKTFVNFNSAYGGAGESFSYIAIYS